MSEKATTPTAWSLRKVEGPRDEVIEKVQGAQSVPAEWKAALVTSINQCPAEWRGVTLDAHCHALGGAVALNLHLKRLF